MQGNLVSRKTFQGKVTSAKMNKTIVVEIERLKMHPIYQKRTKATTHLHVHDSKGIAKEGDLVVIEATRPISKTKRFRLKEIIKHS